MSDYTVHGFNPMNVSHIEIRKGFRCGPHPLKAKFFDRKYPILSLFFNPYTPGIGDGYYKPRVVVYSADGSYLKSFYAKSYKHAHDLRDDMYNKLNFYLERSIRNIYD